MRFTSVSGLLLSHIATKQVTDHLSLITDNPSHQASPQFKLEKILFNIIFN